MNGLGGLNKSPNGVVLGMVQMQLPTVVMPDDLAAQTAGIVTMVGKARRNMATMDLVAGCYRLPWEDEVAVTDGTSCGFDAPGRRYGETLVGATE
jgi:hypothetical protein